MRRTPGTVRNLALLTAAVTTLSVLGACGFGDDDRTKAAERTARALASHDLSSIRFAGDTTAKQAQTEYDARLGNLASMPAKVAVGEVKTGSQDDTASAPLTWTWKLPGKTWTSTATLRLRKSGEAWRPVWSATAIDRRLTGTQRLQLSTRQAPRADILGAGGARLVTLRPVTTYGVDKAQVSPGEAVDAATRLAVLLDLDPGTLRKRVRAAGDQQFVPAITLRDGEPQRPSGSALAAIPGARGVSGEQPLAATKGFAAAILGSVGDPTREQIAAAEKSGSLLLPGDQVGVSGLQQRYDAQLIGTPGITVSLVSTTGEKTSSKELLSTEPKPGRPLRTTLDPKAQRLAQQTLADTGSVSGLVAIRPSTGQVVAAASGPADNGYNTASIGRYAPGSTFKVVSSLALIRAGVTPRTMVDCPPTLTVDGKRFKNYDDYPPSKLGRVSFGTAIANSCNTAVIGQRDKVTGTALADAAAALGLGVDQSVGFPAYFGQVPPPASKTEAAADLIGQGRVQASVLSMATVVASVVKGSVVVPSMVPATTVKAKAPEKPLTAAEARQLRALMRGVVTEGSGSQLADLPGPPVIAKTGTAEFGTRQPLQTHAWMVAGHGDLAVAVFVDQGDSGSGTAGPLLERFLRGYQ